MIGGLICPRKSVNIQGSNLMEEICAHIVDIVANSVSAGAKNISIALAEDSREDLLTLRIVDDGRGMDEETAMRVLDPFFSTKIGKKVGLGVPLLKGTSEQSGGSFYLKSEVGKGTEIFSSFVLSHPDRPPLGSVKDTIFMLTIGNPDVDFLFEETRDGKVFVLDTKEIRAALGGVPINHPEVIKFLGNYLDATL
jgi:hypothetical protein